LKNKATKKLSISVPFILVSLLLVVSSKNIVYSKTVAETSYTLKFDKNSISDIEGEVHTLLIKNTVGKPITDKVQFMVDKPSIVKILELGEVPDGIILKLLKPGETIVTAKINDSTASCKIKVLPFTSTTSTFKLKGYFGDLHSHTGYSDGKLTPDDAFKQAKLGLKADFLAITDHTPSISDKEWFETIRAAEKYNEVGKFLAIPSYEGYYHLKTDVEDGRIIMNGNEAIGYNTLEKPYSINEEDDTYSMMLKYDRAVAMFPHPGEASGDSNLIWNAYDEYRRIHPSAREIMRLLEVRNETSAYNMLHEASYTVALDHGWYISPAAISDNHSTGWTTDYNFRTVILTPKLTRQHLYEAIKENRVYATEDNNLELRFYVNNHIMGSKLKCNTEGTYDIKITAREPDKGNKQNKIAKLEVISDYGKVVYSKDLNSYSSNESIKLSSDTARYFFVRITKKDGKKAWSSPVWTGRAFDPVKPREEKNERIANKNWIITAANVEEGTASKAFDGNIETCWQSTGENAEFIVDMGKEEKLAAIGYVKHTIPLADEKEANKLMADYEYYISADNKNWTKAASGTIRTFGREYYQSFTPTVGRYVKIKAIKPLRGSAISGGEFYLYRGM
jgi:hypothetical protein